MYIKGFTIPNSKFSFSKFKSYLFEFYLLCEGLAVRLALLYLYCTYMRSNHVILCISKIISQLKIPFTFLVNSLIYSKFY